jgi:hypothetical protein
MKHILAIFIFVAAMAACKKKESCNLQQPTITKRNANAGQSNGYIKVTAPRGNQYQYSINGGAFQADSVFNNLAIGSYKITVKEGDCTAEATFSIGDICAGVTTNVVTTKVDAITGQMNGSITVTQPIGSGITYSLNGGAFQASTNFNNLAAGNYNITAKTADGCLGNTTNTITGYGPKYYAVKQIIQGYCGPCHLNGGSSGGSNLDSDANIVNQKARIKARAVDNLPSVMPQGGPLTAADKQKITDWLAAGGTTSN